MENRELREYLNDVYEEADEVIIFENPEYDDAVIGISQDDRLVYDYELMIECLVKNEGMTYEDAADFISYNSSFSVGGREPIIMYHLEV